MQDFTLLLSIVSALFCLSFALGAIANMINTLNSKPCQFCKKPVLNPATVCPNCGREKVNP